MNQPASKQSAMHDPEWARRRKDNVRLAWLLAAVAVGVFALALWKFRPF